MLALAIPLVTVSFAAFVGILEITHSNQLHEELRLEIERTARISSEMLAPPLWYVNLPNLTTSLRVLLGHPDIQAVEALNIDQTTLVWCTRSAEEADCVDDGDVLLALDRTALMSHVEPIYFGQDELRRPVGELRIHFSESRVDNLMRWRLQRDLLFFVTLILSLVIGIFFATQRSILTPLKRWRQAMQKSRENSLRSVDWASGDEIGELIGEYNKQVSEESEKLTAATDRLKLYQDAFESLDHGFCIFDRDFHLKAFNRRYLEILDHSEGSVEIGMSLKTLLRGNAAKGEYGSASIDAVIIDRLAIAASNQRYQRQRERIDGTIIDVDSCPMPEGGFVSIYTDITERKTLESQMRHMALRDTTTGVANRALFQDRLRQALALADRVGTHLAVFLVDVDGFRHINEIHGRDVGDFVLKELGDRLRGIVRQSDTVGRFENDRFALLQLYVASADDAAILAHRILGSVSRSFEVAGHALEVMASVGVTMYPDDDQDSRNILKNALLALTAAKAEGSHSYRFFVPEVHREVASRRNLEEQLFNGLRKNQFVLEYQPRVDLASHALVGAEALVRWRHPERGLLPATEFLPLAEERGLLAPLTEWILEEACRQRLEWQRRFSDHEQTWRVVVPVPLRHFEHGRLVERIRQILADISLDHPLLEIKVSTEDLIHDSEASMDVLRTLREMKIRLVVEEFGNGTSPFHSIKRLPIDGFRLNRRLVGDLNHDLENDSKSDGKTAVIIRGLIRLGDDLGLRVSVEGVENAQLLDHLREQGCHEARGEAISPPRMADEFITWFHEH